MTQFEIEPNFKPELISKTNNKKIDSFPEKNYPLIFSFEWINLGDTEFSFDDKGFKRKDAVKLLDRLYVLSNFSYSQLLNMKGSEQKRSFGSLIHFNIANLQDREKIINMLKSHLAYLENEPKIEEKLDLQLQVIQFSIYTDVKGACRKCNRKSPRVYSILGKEGVLYPIFLDLYHETHPTKHYKCPVCHPNY